MNIKYYKREFLNSDKGHAFVEADGDSLSIADCNRVVTLTFWIGSGEVKEAKLVEEKIDRLYNFINEYRKYIKKCVKAAHKEAKEAGE